LPDLAMALVTISASAHAAAIVNFIAVSPHVAQTPRTQI
jgi:hypothetical protein